MTWIKSDLRKANECYFCLSSCKTFEPVPTGYSALSTVNLCHHQNHHEVWHKQIIIRLT